MPAKYFAEKRTKLIWQLVVVHNKVAGRSKVNVFKHLWACVVAAYSKKNVFIFFIRNTSPLNGTPQKILSLKDLLYDFCASNKWYTTVKGQDKRAARALDRCFGKCYYTIMQIRIYPTDYRSWLTIILDQKSGAGQIKAELVMDFHVTGNAPLEEEIDEYLTLFNEDRPVYSLNYLTPKQYRESYALVVGVK